MGVNSENSNRVADTEVAEGNGSSIVTFIDVQVQGSDQLNSDGQVMRFGHNGQPTWSGPVTLIGCDFYASESGGSYRDAKIGFTQEKGVLLLRGCSFNNVTPLVANGGAGYTDVTFDGVRGYAGGGVFRRLNASATTITPWLYNTGDTTPAVPGLSFLMIANTSPITITNLDEGVAGQEVTLKFNDANTILQNNTNLRLAGATDFISTFNDTLTLINVDGSVWYEKCRSIN
jgi:hypothetical protein